MLMTNALFISMMLPRVASWDWTENITAQKLKFRTFFTVNLGTWHIGLCHWILHYAMQLYTVNANQYLLLVPPYLDKLV